MKECWAVLGIAPTDDLERIRRAYLDLVKRYHPDRVATPEQKDEYTAICAEINRAYKQATTLAKNLPDDGEAQFNATDEYAGQEWSADSYEAGSRYNRAFAGFFKSGLAVGTLLLLIFGLQLILSFAGPLEGIPESIKLALSIIVALFAVVFIYGLILAGTIDVLLILFFPTRLIGSLGLEKYRDRLLALSILAVNFALFFFTNLIPAHPGTGQIETLVDLFARTLAASTAPLLLGLKAASSKQ